jgi:FkbM family methyltransferase
MRLIELFLKLNGKFSFLRKFSQKQMRVIVLNKYSREKLNRVYHQLSYYEKSIFHALFSRIFRDGGHYELDSFWVVKFAGKEIKMPLRGNSLWLDWDSAISIVGHDIEIKEYYERAILSDNPPKSFLDIGANYGTHSLLFSACGIPTYSVEPNPNCKPFYDDFLKLNQLKGNWFPIALGEMEGKGNLVFPSKETWLGSFNLSIQNGLEKYSDLSTQEVDIKTLDNLVKTRGIMLDLVKMDTEGFEIQVLKGALKNLNKNSPVILFESNKKDRDANIFEFLTQYQFDIKSLNTHKKVSLNEFMESKEANFIAVKG